jgi:hypothetical protein
MKNILAENMQRFGTKNLSESDIEKLNEAYPYDQLQNNPSPAVIAKAIYDAKGGTHMGMGDAEAWVVAALIACKDYNTWSAVANYFKKKYGLTVVMYMRKFLKGQELISNLHNGKSVIGELERLYGSSDRAYKAAIQYFDLTPSLKDRFKTQAFKGTRADS